MPSTWDLQGALHLVGGHHDVLLDTQGAVGQRLAGHVLQRQQVRQLLVQPAEHLLPQHLLIAGIMITQPGTLFDVRVSALSRAYSCKPVSGVQHTSVASSLGFMSVHVSAGITHSPGEALRIMRHSQHIKGYFGLLSVALLPPLQPTWSYHVGLLGHDSAPCGERRREAR